MTIHEALKDLLDISEFGSRHVIVGDHIVFVTIGPDLTPLSPEEWGQGKVYSFNRRHSNFIVGEPLEDLKEQYGPDIIPLSYFEHGQCTWGVMGSMNHWPDMQWDGRSYAGIWVPEKYVLTDLEGLPPEERHAKLVERAANFCEAYTQYCNGDVYYARVEMYKVRQAPTGQVFDEKSDYRYEDAVLDESCGGLYGSEGVKNFLEGTLQEVTHILTPKEAES